MTYMWLLYLTSLPGVSAPWPVYTFPTVEACIAYLDAASAHGACMEYRIQAPEKPEPLCKDWESVPGEPLAVHCKDFYPLPDPTFVVR